MTLDPKEIRKLVFFKHLNGSGGQKSKLSISVFAWG